MSPIDGKSKQQHFFALRFEIQLSTIYLAVQGRRQRNMTASPKNWRDRAWLVWFVMQVLIILCEQPPSYFGHTENETSPLVDTKWSPPADMSASY